mgnify:CR=1 FL=1
MSKDLVDQNLQRKKDLAWTQMGEDLVILKLGKIRTVHQLNPIAKLVWEQLESPNNPVYLTLKVGDEFEVTVPCSEGYGERKADHQQQVPIKHLQGAKRWKAGMVAMVQTEKGARQVTIVKAGLKHATVDLNHPLAGKDLTFNIQILEMRDATDDEVAHGHAHGIGGHHH